MKLNYCFICFLFEYFFFKGKSFFSSFEQKKSPQNSFDKVRFFFSQDHSFRIYYINKGCVLRNFKFRSWLNGWQTIFVNSYEINLFDNLVVKSRFFKKRELYWSNLPQNSNCGQELVQKSGVQIPVGEVQIFLSHFLFIFMTLPHGDLNPGFLNKTFPPKILILREIRSIELTFLKKSRLYYLNDLSFYNPLVFSGKCYLLRKLYTQQPQEN